MTNEEIIQNTKKTLGMRVWTSPHFPKMERNGIQS